MSALRSTQIEMSGGMRETEVSGDDRDPRGIASEELAKLRGIDVGHKLRAPFG
jgi:hypothetical protein